jgi:hypothetical protein
MKQAVGLHWDNGAMKPRANALGWYEAGRWPESNGPIQLPHSGPTFGQTSGTP